MFLGHYAVALAAKKSAPEISLGTLFIAAQFIDLLWPLFLLLGLEHVRIDPGNTVVTPLDFFDYPLTHSLAGAVVWSLLFGGVFMLAKRNIRCACIIAVCVVSHWILDFLTHRPDLPLWFEGNVFVGLGLWNSLPGTLVVELSLFAFGIILYLRTTTSTDHTGRIGFWLLIVILTLIYLGNITGPSPPDESTIAVTGNASWLFVMLAYWIDRHRTPYLGGAGNS